MNLSFNENLNSMQAVERGNNMLVLSSLKEFYHPVKSQGFSIKYVVEGIERYTLNGQKYPIETGKYLLSNFTNEGHVEVQSDKSVKGICINLVPELLSEVIASFQRPDTAFSDVDLGHFFHSSHFLENHYDAQKTHLGKLLIDLSAAVQDSNLSEDDFDIEFFYHLSEKIIADQIPIFKQLQAIPSIKSTTKKELIKRVFKGKEFIDFYFSSPLTIEQVAKESCMSEYHFFRLFKAIYGLTPHQYTIRRRLDYGQKILKRDKNAVSIAAIESGFSDIYTFSIAFKNYFGYSPSSLLK